MKYDWILDVIADLEAFAIANGMRDLALELAELKLIAAADISAKEAQDLLVTHSVNAPRRPH